VVAFDILAIVVGVACELCSIRVVFLPRHEVFYIAVSFGLHPSFVFDLGRIRRQIDVEINKPSFHHIKCEDVVVVWVVVDNADWVLQQMSWEFVGSIFWDHVEFAEDLDYFLVRCEKFTLDVADFFGELGIFGLMDFGVCENWKFSHPCAG